MSLPILHLPFKGQWRVYTGGDTAEINNHHGIVAQNFAFDFDKIDEKGEAHSGSGESNEDWYAFGEAVIAPADGTVIEVVDGGADNIPLKTANSYVNAGNHIIIKHSDKAFSFIAHLKQRSVKVKTGEKVEAGQMLGQCGNSGYSLMPHLHYHLQDSPVVVEWHGIKPQAKAKGKKITFSDVTLLIDGHEQNKSSYSPIKLDLIKNGTTKI